MQTTRIIMYYIRMITLELYSALQRSLRRSTRVARMKRGSRRKGELLLSEHNTVHMQTHVARTFFRTRIHMHKSRRYSPNVARRVIYRRPAEAANRGNSSNIVHHAEDRHTQPTVSSVNSEYYLGRDS